MFVFKTGTDPELSYGGRLAARGDIVCLTKDSCFLQLQILVDSKPIRKGTNTCSDSRQNTCRFLLMAPTWSYSVAAARWLEAAEDLTPKKKKRWKQLPGGVHPLQLPCEKKREAQVDSSCLVKKEQR